MWEANVGKGQNFGLTTPKPNCLSKKLACCCQKVWTAILGLYCASGIGPLHKVNGVAKERRPIERGGGRRAQSRNPTLPYPRVPMMMVAMMMIMTMTILRPEAGESTT
jgi:hypothetical protein